MAVRYVKTHPLIDALDYVAYLQDAAAELPDGARAFATADWHYDFYSPRCVKDLELGSVEVADKERDRPGVEMRVHLLPNKFKHVCRLTLSYVGVAEMSLSTGAIPLGRRRLGQLILEGSFWHAPINLCSSGVVVLADQVAGHPLGLKLAAGAKP